MEGNARYLTKSRFKLAAECPRKLYYTGKRDYLDNSMEDSFLAALAEGGYQVGELACLMYPNGVRVDELDHQVALEKTAELLKQSEVTIFEAALATGNYFIRVDILRKVGNRVELIEVKAKSYSQAEDGNFYRARGGLSSEFLPYLRDVAYQRFVARLALPSFEVSAFLMLANKDQEASVDGLNQRFKATRNGNQLRIAVAAGTDRASLGVSLLSLISVDQQVDDILAEDLSTSASESLPFPEAVALFADAYARDAALLPIPSPSCAKCQFKAEQWPSADEPKSGFHECWSEAFNWNADDFAQGTVLDLWNFRGKKQLIDKQILKLCDVPSSAIGFDGQPPGPMGMTIKHRQWYVCRPDWPGGGEYYFDRAGFRQVSDSWTYPLHFIDFETSSVAIPFLAGRRPYEITAFQFSHHVMAEDGSVHHRTQWLNAEPGVDPNILFAMALMAALKDDRGTIFRWSDHENTVLNKIRDQILKRGVGNAKEEELIAFIEDVTARTEKPRKEKTIGSRAMVDLCEIAERFYFHPSTRGSSSLKKVLPALMNSSDFLRETYGKSSYGPGVSLNFVEPMTWWQEVDGLAIDPYSLLPPVFDDFTEVEIQAADSALSDVLREGGAAMAAYARLQFESIGPEMRKSIEGALLRYCELDTLAMVMAVQAWRAESIE